jgi:hypothetical protein
MFKALVPLSRVAGWSVPSGSANTAHTVTCEIQPGARFHKILITGNAGTGKKMTDLIGDIRITLNDEVVRLHSAAELNALNVLYGPQYAAVNGNLAANILTTNENETLGAAGVWPWTASLLRPAAPANLLKTGSGPIALAFDDETGGEYPHEVWKATASGEPFELVGLAPVGAESFSDATGDGAALYKIRAVNFADPSDFLHASVPAAVTDLAIAETASPEWALSWTIPDTGNVTSIEVWRSSDGGAYALAFTIPVVEYLDVGAVFDADAWGFKIKLVNSKGASAFSNEVSTSSPPAAPSGLVISFPTPTDVQLDWDDNSDDESGFYINGASDGGSITGLTDTTANEVSYLFEDELGDPPEGQKCYNVTAFNAAGESAPSNTVYSPPVAVTDLVLTPSTNAIEATFEHVAETSGGWVDEYEVRWRNVTTSGSWHNIAATPFGVPSTNFNPGTDASDGDTIEVGVRAKKGTLTSAWVTDTAVAQIDL